MSDGEAADGRLAEARIGRPAMHRRHTQAAVSGFAATLLVLGGCGGPEPAADPPSEEAIMSQEGSGSSDDGPPADGGEGPALAADTSSAQRLTLHPDGTVDGARLGYAEYLPPELEGAGPPPLLVFLHGSDEAGSATLGSLGNLFVHGLPALIHEDRWPDELPFIVLMPQYGPDLARSCELSEQLAGFLDFALEHYDVDEHRVYVTGVSCGATGTWDYLAQHGGEVVAAAVLVAGRAVGAHGVAGCELGRTPLWVFHGEVDDIVDPADVVPAVEQLQACTEPPPVDLRLTVYPGVGHESWDRTYDLSAGHDVYTWLLGHELG